MNRYWISHANVSQKTVSYADIAASGPKQTPEEAAAPQPPEILSTETASTSSLIDVDAPSVQTVPSDFLEQEIQTETQAARIDREEESKKAKAKAKAAAEKAKGRARETDNWLIAQFSKLSDGSVGALALANLAGVVGLSAFLGYKGWGLYERGRLSWESVGLGFGILAGVGVAESVLGRYLAKAKKD